MRPNLVVIQQPVIGAIAKVPKYERCFFKYRRRAIYNGIDSVKRTVRACEG
jgi:hypothetical protein